MEKPPKGEPEYLGQVGLYIDWIDSLKKDGKAKGYLGEIKKQVPNIDVADVTQMFLVAWDPELFNKGLPFYCNKGILNNLSKSPDVTLGFMTYLRQLKATTNVTVMVRIQLRHFSPYPGITDSELADELSNYFPHARKMATPLAIKKARQRLAEKEGPHAPTANHLRGADLLCAHQEEYSKWVKSWEVIGSTQRGQNSLVCP
jgi:hypothetical protein